MLLSLRSRTLLPMLGLLAVGGLRADMLNLPAQTGTFSSNVRGYWFTAPVAFQITGVGVPTDASSGTQTIEILRLNAPPPQYSSTTNDFTSLFRVVGDSSLGLIPVSIAVGAGDVIGVLGYRGSVNSYGPQSTADIFGNSITLARLGMQFNLNSVPAQDVWTEAGGNISRVNLEYGPAISGVPEPSTWMTLGLGVLSFGALKLRRRSS